MRSSRRGRDGILDLVPAHVHAERYRKRQEAVCFGITRIDQRPCSEERRRLNVGPRTTVQQRQGTDDAFPCVEAFGRLALRAQTLRRVELRAYRCHDLLGDIVLDREGIGEFAIIALGPDMMPGRESKSCAVIRTWLPALRTLPSST